MLIAFNKPYGVLSQFTPEEGSKYRTLAEFGFPKNVYPIGRLDADSEGLLLLSDEAALTEELLNPSRKHPRTYWAQIERIPTKEALTQLMQGVTIGGEKTLPCKAHLLTQNPDLPPRDPPIRHRLSVPTAWLELILVEGKNRQVRRMTAAVGHPTLRLVRVAIGSFKLDDLSAGEWRELGLEARKKIFF